MKRITVFYDNTLYTYRWLSALLFAGKQFEESGYKIEIPGLFHNIKQKFSFEWIKKHGETDIVMFAFHPSEKLMQDKTAVSDLIKYYRKYAKKIIWLDTSDSSGTTRFEVLPFVDKYLKKQLYTDLNLYNEPIYKDRLFCDYYIKNGLFEKKESDKSTNTKISSDDFSKLGLSWNVGLGSLFERSVLRFIFNLNRKTDFTVYYEPDYDKKYDIFYRGSAYPDVTGYQRKLAIRSIVGLKHFTHPDPAFKVSQKEYDAEVRNSKALLSPFGWGEICTRDFEAFRNGALLIKPKMDHMVTYPDVFLKNKTFVEINWDFTDLEEKLGKVLNNKGEYLRIAKEGQNLYRYYLSEEGKKDFALHLIKQIDG